MAGPIRIVLIEDNDTFRSSLELLFELDGDLEVVASAADGRDAVALCRASGADVAVLDYRLPGLDGVQLAAALRDACPDVAVVCLTAEVSGREQEALRVAGAVSCVTKDQPLDEIVAAIKAAAHPL